VNLLQQELENKLRNVLQQINDATATATKAAVTKPKTAVSNTVFTVTVAV